MRKDWNEGWMFRKFDQDEKEEVRLPHDAMLFEERSADQPSGSAGAFFSGGKYIYEKNFFVPLEWKEKEITFEFEGVYKKSVVNINGKEANYCSHGYRPFWIKADPFLEYGKENTIQVIADNSEMPNSRWYTGSGIYRPVWIWQQEKIHILPTGVKITTISIDPAKILVDVSSTGGIATIDIIDSGEKIISAKTDNEGRAELTIPEAKLWSDDSPHLYECNVTLSLNDSVIEKRSVLFGIRKIEWSPKGLFINGKETLLRGGCIHHDNGILGAKTYEKSEFRRVKILKEAGFNALRSSHNFASEALVKACDYYGMYLIDETWDMWYSRKNKYDYALDFKEGYHTDLKAMVEKDYNHPAVIMYSIGNEISEPASQEGLELEEEIISILHELDPTRPVTCGMNLMIVSMAAKGEFIYKDDGGRDEKQQLPNSSKMFNIMTSKIGVGMNHSSNSKEANIATSPSLDLLDIAGYNYASGRYPLEGEANPNRLLYGSETFPQDIYKNWEMVKKYPYLIGDFMWTAWDYLGEVGAGAWAYSEDDIGFEKPYPWLLADMGVFDILGNDNGEAGYASIVWGTAEKPYICVQPPNHGGIEPAKSVWRGTNALPSWSWKNCVGNDAIVEVYADADLIVLHLNGEEIGRQKVEEMKALFHTRYKAGHLEAIAYNKDNYEIGRNSLTSAEEELRVGVNPEEMKVRAGEIVYVPIKIEDKNGIVESNADRLLHIHVIGGELLGFGSANPRTEESYVTTQCTSYYGKALAVVLCSEPGEVTIEIEAERLSRQKATIEVLDKKES
ncbi:glycoside hydrolase family 2 TIM barrel-domain containing protein [Trichococcus flocculiformis]|uniref:glycoside hydrolase family 2 TIM barrel-domain containing protein n=1 Tax=Trichococcus flocculiformis TaxID=82803 RepID=UPI002AAB2BE8|nr:glycoside hydrolase family 2 TIM barrel-domain containing protein [Trichococcus flocculiformis]